MEVVVPGAPSQPHRQWAPEELLEIGFSRPPLFAPGTEFDYSNTNTVLLGLVIEKACGRPLNDYIEEHIARPRNLAHTLVPVDAALPSPHAQGYTKTPDGQTVLRDRLESVVGIRCGKHGFDTRRPTRVGA